MTDLPKTVGELVARVRRDMAVKGLALIAMPGALDPEAHVRVEGTGWTVTSILGAFSFQPDQDPTTAIEHAREVRLMPDPPETWTMYVGSAHSYTVDGTEKVTFL